MNEMQSQVAAFMRKMRQYIGEKPHIPPSDVVSLRARLIQSEANELAEALWAGDLTEIIDGCCDLVYVTVGTAESCGFDMTPFFDEVQRSNMAKDPDCKDEHGKVIKPAGWKPPAIKDMLDDCNAFIAHWHDKDAQAIAQVFMGLPLLTKSGPRGIMIGCSSYENMIYIDDYTDGAITTQHHISAISWRNTWALQYREQRNSPWPT